MDDDDDDDGGYDANFISPPPNEFRCVICTFILKNPVQIALCGHRLCSKCFENWKISRRSAELFCPTDRKVIDQKQVFPDVGIERHVLSLEVKCDYYANGCHWYGELRNLKSHTADCFYQKKDALPELHLRLRTIEKRQESETKSLDKLQQRLESLDARLKNEIKRSDNASKGTKTTLKGYNLSIAELKNEMGNIGDQLEVLPDHHKRLNKIETKQGNVTKSLNKLQELFESIDARLKNEIKKSDNVTRTMKDHNLSMDNVQSEMGCVKAHLKTLPVLKERLNTLEQMQPNMAMVLEKLQNHVSDDANMLSLLEARFVNEKRMSGDAFKAFTWKYNTSMKEVHDRIDDIHAQGMPALHQRLMEMETIVNIIQEEANTPKKSDCYGIMGKCVFGFAVGSVIRYFIYNEKSTAKTLLTRLFIGLGGCNFISDSTGIVPLTAGMCSALLW